MSGSIVGLLIMTPLFKPACRNKKIKKRERIIAYAHESIVKVISRKQEGSCRTGRRALQEKVQSFPKSDGKEEAGCVHRAFLNMLKTNLESFNTSFVIHSLVKD